MKIYRPILQKAWEITRRYKFLWFFGAFAAILGNGGEVEIVYNNIISFPEVSNNLSFLKELYKAGRLEELFNFFSQYFSTGTPIAIINSILIILIFLLFIWLIVISQSAIINKVYKQQKGELVGFDESFRVGRKFFKPVFLITLISRLIIYGLYAVIGGPLLYFYLKSADASWGIVATYMTVSFLIFVPISFIIAFIAKYAISFVVIKGMKIGKAMKEGWRLFVKNWLISLEMSVVIFLINILVGLAFLVAFVLISLPLLLLSSFFVTAAGSMGGTFISVFVSAIIFVGLVLMGSALAVFQFSSWTMLFLKLTEGKVLSKLARLFAPIKVK